MTNSPAALRTLVIFGIILPLALLLGYLLATPLAFRSLGTVFIVLAILSSPLWLRWHHPLLILCWNMSAVLFFLPGQLPFWLALAFASFTISLVKRALDRKMTLIRAYSVLLPLLFIGLVVLITARLTGGFGFRALGGETYGGKRYLFMLGAIVGFMAITAHTIPLRWANLYTGLFFCSAIVSVIGNTVTLVSPSFYFIFAMFPVTSSDLQMVGNEVVSGSRYDRLFGVSMACMGIIYFMLARYGFKGMLGGRKTWRFLLLLVLFVISMLGGFRSFLALVLMTCFFVFCLEGLLKSRYLFIFAVLGIFLVGALVPLANKLPLSIQRTLSFLPLNVDPIVRFDANNSTEWRLEIWRKVTPEIPKYLWLGKGLGIQGRSLELETSLARTSAQSLEDLTELAGDYHNGPLSVIIPFGIWGVIGWLWFLWAATRALYLNYRNGDPQLKTINRFLFAFFVIRIIHFFFIFGGFYSDLAIFTGIVGLSVSLNNGIRKRASVPAYVPTTDSLMRTTAMARAAR